MAGVTSRGYLFVREGLKVPKPEDIPDRVV